MRTNILYSIDGETKTPPFTKIGDIQYSWQLTKVSDTIKKYIMSGVASSMGTKKLKEYGNWIVRAISYEPEQKTVVIGVSLDIDDKHRSYDIFKAPICQKPLCILQKLQLMVYGAYKVKKEDES